MRTLKIISVWMAIIAMTSVIPAQSFSDQAPGPVCVVQKEGVDHPIPLSPELSQYNIIITDGLAHFQLIQTFVNRFEGADEIVYVFPLPHDGAVHYMSMELNGEIYQAEILEKEEAQKKYDSTLAEGGTGTLLLQQRPNVFQQRLANIPFGDTAYIETRVSLPLEYLDGKYSLTIPTRVVPRYGESLGPLPSSNGSLWNPPAEVDGSRLKVHVLLETGFPVTHLKSPSHPHQITGGVEVKSIFKSSGLVEPEAESTQPHSKSLLLNPISAYPNKDFVLEFSREGAAFDFFSASDFDTTESIGHFAMNIFPSDEEFEGDRPNLEIMLLIDISGSQSGWPLTKEKEIAHAILDRLQPEDKMTVMSFNNQNFWAFGVNNVVDVTTDNIQTAKNFVNNLYSSGGTQLLNAVKALLNVPVSSENKRIFVFLTDGQITNETAILEEIGSHPSSPTIFTYGAGNNLNHYFLDRSAEIGNGFSTTVNGSQDVGPLVQNAWDKIESPQITNLQVEIEGTQTSGLIRRGGQNLYLGQPIQIYGRYAEGGNHNVVVTGTRNGEVVRIEKNVQFAANKTFNAMVPQIWARNKITELMLEQGNSGINKQEIIDISLHYQVLSQYTAFLAIEPKKVEYDSPISAAPGKILKGKVRQGLFMEGGYLNLILPGDEIIRQIVIYDIHGRIVYKQLFNRNTSEIRWDGVLQNGMKIQPGKYFMRVLTASNVINRQFIWK